MPLNNVAIIGTSAGSIETLKSLASKLPRDLPASIFIVVHIGSNRSTLPELVSAAGPLPAVRARDGQEVLPGMIYVAPPDHHLCRPYLLSVGSRSRAP